MKLEERAEQLITHLLQHGPHEGPATTLATELGWNLSQLYDAMWYVRQHQEVFNYTIPPVREAGCITVTDVDPLTALIKHLQATLKDAEKKLARL